MPEMRLLAAALFLAAQSAVIYWAAGEEHPPAPPHLERLQQQFGGWVQVREDPLDPGVKTQLGADRLLSRTYLHLPGGPFANLFVAWFHSQRDGTAQPHSPKVCLPGSGWIPETSAVVSLATPAGRIPVNRYVIANRGSRALVLYWFQTARRTIASEWSAKFWLAADGLRDRRTDTAIVRITLAIPPGKDAAATYASEAFARDVYPLLRQELVAVSY